ncbi:DUF6461 domain-containing protein [Microbispora sp. NPDC004025]
MRPAFDLYNNAIRALFDEPACVTWIRGADVGAVVRRFGGNEQGLSRGEFNDIFEAYEMEPDEGVVLISQVGDWTLTVEATRYLGIRRLEELSKPGEALGLAWNGVSRFAYAVGGDLSRRFAPFSLRDRSADPDALEWASGYGVTAEYWEQDWLAAAFTLAERISGIRIDQSWKERNHLVLRVCYEFQDEENRPRPGLILKPEMWELISRHPRIAAIAADPSPERIEEVSAVTAELVIRAAGLENPLIGRALGAIAEGLWGSSTRGLQDDLAVMAAEFRTAADAVLEEGADVLLPTPDTQWGRLYMKHYAVNSLMALLHEEGYFGLLPSLEYAKSVTAGRRRSDDTYRLLRVLKIISFHMANGENAIRG